MSRTKRARSRGAAMVEAAVVMPVMVSFLGMMVYFHSVYQNKQDAMNEARSALLTKISKDCADPQSSSPNLGQDTQGAANAGGLGPAMSTVFDVQSMPSKTHTARGKYRVASGWSKPMTHTSFGMCNEKRRGGDLGALVGFGADIVTGKAGGFF